MIRDLLVNMGINKVTVFIIRHSDFTDIGVELVMFFVTIPVGLVGPDCLLVPLTGKYTLAANVLESFANATNAGK
ncbi:hypothetical protein D3C72_2306830 [compost metagenome]